MKKVIQTLKGNLTLDQAIAAHVREIRSIGQRSSSYTLKTVRGEGFAQTELYPVRSVGQDASKKKVAAD